jgi:uncharacterized protein DUF5063
VIARARRGSSSFGVFPGGDTLAWDRLIALPRRGYDAGAGRRAAASSQGRRDEHFEDTSCCHDWARVARLEALDSIAAFAAIAERYCAWVEGEPLSPEAEVRAVRRLLAELYAGALALPSEVEFEGGPDAPRESRRGEVFARLESLPVSFYGVCLDPMATVPQELGIGDVTDDLADIYSDLRRGLGLYRAGRPGDAAWDWSFNFGAHWGDHLIGALAAIHAWRSERGGDGDPT